METKDITILSVRGRGINSELKVIEDRLRDMIPEVQFYEYSMSEISSMDDVVKRHRLARRKNTKNMHGVICMDSSVPLQFPNNEEGDHRLFVPVLYNYLFDVAAGQKKGLKTFSGCTHILPGSPFMSDLLKEKYVTENVQILDYISTPFAWDICQKDRQEEFRERYEFYFPGMKGKKIISIMIVGEKEEPLEKNEFLTANLKEFADLIRGEYFLITNSPALMEAAGELSSEYMDTLGFLTKRFSQSEIMYVTDIMITNSGRYASAVASRRIPVYVLDYLDNIFIKYVKNTYPDIILQIGKLKDILAKSDKIVSTQEQFCINFSYDTSVNPLKEIGMIFSGK